MSNPPDQILDIRVRVPFNAIGKYVLRIGDQLIPIENVYPAIDRPLKSTVKDDNSLIDKLGIEVGHYGKVRMKDLKRQDFEQAMTDGCKPVIKGGWLNIWRCEHGLKWDSIPRPTRQAADTAPGLGVRIACIQIPDITEGEGL